MPENYDAMLKADLFDLAEKRGLEPGAEDLKAELVDILEAADKKETDPADEEVEGGTPVGEEVKGGTPVGVSADDYGTPSSVHRMVIEP